MKKSMETANKIEKGCKILMAIAVLGTIVLVTIVLIPHALKNPSPESGIAGMLAGITLLLAYYKYAKDWRHTA